MRDTQQLIRTVLNHAQSLDAGIDEGSVDPFVGLETTHYQTKYFREQLGLIVSAHINIIVHPCYCDILRNHWKEL